MSARVARLRPPGNWWYLAVCEECDWCDMSWRYEAWAKDGAQKHNAQKHTTKADKTRPDGVEQPDYPCCYRCFTGRHDICDHGDCECPDTSHAPDGSGVLHNPASVNCVKNIPGEPTQAGARCFHCDPVSSTPADGHRRSVDPDGKPLAYCAGCFQDWPCDRSHPVVHDGHSS